MMTYELKLVTIANQSSKEGAYKVAAEHNLTNLLDNAVSFYETMIDKEFWTDLDADNRLDYIYKAYEASERKQAPFNFSVPVVVVCKDNVVSETIVCNKTNCEQVFIKKFKEHLPEQFSNIGLGDVIDNGYIEANNIGISLTWVTFPIDLTVAP